VAVSALGKVALDMLDLQFHTASTNSLMIFNASFLYFWIPVRRSAEEIDDAETPPQR
jgi:hypothetical protein